MFFYFFSLPDHREICNPRPKGAAISSRPQSKWWRTCLSKVEGGQISLVAKAAKLTRFGHPCLGRPGLADNLVDLVDSIFFEKDLLTQPSKGILRY